MNDPDKGGKVGNSGCFGKNMYEKHKKETNHTSYTDYETLPSMKKIAWNLNYLIACMSKSIQIHLFDLFTCTKNY